MTIPDGTNLPPVKIAFVIDGEIADILHTDERLAAIFTSEPLMLDVTNKVGKNGIAVGYLYNYETGEFTPPLQTENRE
jgi:hypothetical protein